MSGVEEQNRLVTRILRGEIDKAGVKKELERISAEYGEDCFNSYVVKKKAKPWTYKELKELEILSTSGAASKEFYLYMSEVSDEVYAKKAAKKKISILAGVILVIALVVGLVAFVK